MSFALRSKNVRFEFPYLMVECQRSDNDWVISALRLNSGNENINWALKWQEGGNFMASSMDYWLEVAILHCQSKNIAGKWVHAQINLKDHILNDNGVLKFQGLNQKLKSQTSDCWSDQASVQNICLRES